MRTMSERPGLEAGLRRNRLDGAGLYFGRRGTLRDVDADRLEPFLHEWAAHSPYLRMGLLPLVAAGLFDDGAPHTVSALLGDRFLDLSVDDDFVIPGMLRTQLPQSMSSKRSCLKDSDREAFLALTAKHQVCHERLLDGPWTLMLVRTATFGFPSAPLRLELLVGLGMRPKDSKGLPLPEGVELWKSHRWHIAHRRVAELRAPEVTLEVDPGGLLAALEDAQREFLAAAQTPAWQKMVAAAGWTEVDLEVQLYVRLDEPAPGKTRG